MASSRLEQRVDAGGLRAVATAIFHDCGMEEQDATLLADTLVAADLGGVHSHGVLRVPEYVKKLTSGGAKPRGRPRVVRDSGACLVVDGDGSMGQIGAQFAMQQAIERSETTGIAAVAVRGSNHCGAMAYYAEQALAHDMIGIATTNTLPVMAPWGSLDKILGINPLGVAIPAGEEAPIVYDAAFSGSSHGKIRIYQQRGQSIPEGWALDREGRPTTDPVAAMAGLLMQIGGFKGTALAMIMGILSAMLSGASYSTELGDMEAGPRPGQDGHFFIALRVGAFEEVARFKARVDGAIRELHACRPAPGFDRIYAPGEREFLNRLAYQRDGIPLTAATLSDLRRAAAERGVDDATLRAT